ncbi:indole-3-glycerol phosphate synthase TrpC [Sandaracinus amylolyticus]|uniref:indole-3-glycerol phosphate synthase TrpC n=1 Tax=Sandaracinus amylolyticus TaxID=927083 RepID=UPI001F16D889|nr:indole-3-glycerol-phosphate synthase [Sandaracinus amylolyticus]UJR80272.1 Indole-3-glycerol-phosphate synthase TrpC [Sandaracinus amylolyticus]
MGAGRVTDHLSAILERKRGEVIRRARHPLPAIDDTSDRGARALAALRRPAGAPPRVIAEIKRRSPSAGVIRPRALGDIVAIARAYEASGAAAVSVLADGPGFGGGVLDVRRAARAVGCPVLFKEFVIDPRQIDLARASGASLVLLLVRALTGPELDVMIDAVRRRGMEPVVEAADAAELSRALQTNATIVGVNARDLRSFQLDGGAASRALQEVPNDRIAVYMSGVGTREDFARVADGRADAVLIGTELMRAPDPGARLREILGDRA